MNFLLQYAQWDRSYLWNKCWESQIKSKTGTKWILWSVTNCCAFVRDTWVACRMVAVQTMKPLVTSDFFFMFEFWIVYSWQSTSDRSSTYPASSPKSGHFAIKIQVYLKKPTKKLETYTMASGVLIKISTCLLCNDHTLTVTVTCGACKAAALSHQAALR